MKPTRRRLASRLRAGLQLSLLGSLLTALSGCQGLAGAQQAGQLSLRVQWPAFRTQALLPATQSLVVAVYREQFTGSPDYLILERGQERAVFARLAAGKARVLCLALDPQARLLNGDFAEITVLPQQKTQLVLELQPDPLADLSAAEQAALMAWLKGLFPGGMPSAAPLPVAAATPLASATPQPSAQPTAQPTAQPAEGSGSVPTSPTPEPTPSPTPPPASGGGSTGSSSGGGSASQPAPSASPSEGGSLSGEVTLQDGAPRDQTVEIQ